MARSMLMGCTDYSHQSLEDMEHDLGEWINNLILVIQILDKNKKQLIESNYWYGISHNIQEYFDYSEKFFKTSKKELESILKEIQTKILDHHVNRIRSLANTAKNVYINLGKYWHEDPWDFNKEFENPNFEIVESYYREARGMAADMVDLSNLASRLDVFIGLERETSKRNFLINTLSQEKRVRVFISYSWDDEEHKKWVKNLAIQLRQEGVDVILDQWELIPGDQIPEFMEKAVRNSDYVLIICTHKYKERSDNRLGGVGYEGDIMTAEVINKQNNRKFIPILREKIWNESSPSWLSGKYYIDLSATPYSRDQYNDLLATLLGKKEKAPPLGSSTIPKASSKTNQQNIDDSVTNRFIPVQIIGVIVDQVGIPKNDGTRGCALYEIPFKLAQKPPSEWKNLFIENWNHPPEFTLMHRPGIASIVEDKIILNGTTIEEVRDYHRKTLILAIQKTNRQYQALLEKKQKVKEIKQAELSKHKENIKNISNQIKFDED